MVVSDSVFGRENFRVMGIFKIKNFQWIIQLFQISQLSSETDGKKNEGKSFLSTFDGFHLSKGT